MAEDEDLVTAVALTKKLGVFADKVKKANDEAALQPLDVPCGRWYHSE